MSSLAKSRRPASGCATRWREAVKLIVDRAVSRSGCAARWREAVKLIVDRAVSRSGYAARWREAVRLIVDRAVSRSGYAAGCVESLRLSRMLPRASFGLRPPSSGGARLTWKGRCR